MSRKPSLRNVLPREELLSFSRVQARDTDQMTVKEQDLPEHEEKGWTVLRHNKSSVRIHRPKPKSDLLEARVWRVMYKMGFPYLSGPGGGQLVLNNSDPQSPTQQLDVVAIDDEVAVAIECKSYKNFRKDTRFAEKLAKHAGIRGGFAKAVEADYPLEHKRQIGTPVVTWDLEVRDNDFKRADEAQVVLFDEQELEYYEELVKHVGPAARYQLLSDLFRGKQIRGLSVRVPALQTRMGSLTCYTFSVRPDYLLKICYIAHRAKGKAVDVDAYQRMLNKKRIKDIGAFITDDGIFPTNIVVNFEDARHVRFDRGRQESGSGDTGGLFGWLTIDPSYGTAWIIDGQHRLFGYSGHERASTSYLNVLAFEGLSAAKQTELFVDINSEQRRVPRRLLVELDATLKWDSEVEEKRVNAIVSKACMGLDESQSSPLFGRVLLSDMRRTNTRCVSLTALASALSKPGFFLIRQKKGFREYGPLWRDDPMVSLKRTQLVVSNWLGTIAVEAVDWWELGADDGGGLAMNDGVTVCIRMLRSVLDHLDHDGRVGALDDKDLVARLDPYAKAIGAYFARMSAEKRRRFRALRGGQGQDTGTRECQAALNQEFERYQPDGLEEWQQRVKANTNDRARRIIDHIETAIQDRVLLMLREEFDLDEEAWWYEGVPVNVRKKVRDRIEDAGGGLEEENFDLLHYEVIMRQHWPLFRSVFAFGAGKNIGKDRGTGWLREIAGWRNTVMHPSRRDYLGLDELAQLEHYRDWLDQKLAEPMDESA